VVNNPGEELVSLRQNTSVDEADRGFDSDTEIVTMDRDEPHSQKKQSEGSENSLESTPLTRYI
jgi:hypothetical protein